MEEIKETINELGNKVNYLGQELVGIKKKQEEIPIINKELKEIPKALVGFQGEVTNPKQNKANNFFDSKYAPLEEVIKTIKPVLHKYGLSVLQIPEYTSNNNCVGVTTILFHESGEVLEFPKLWIRCEKPNAQGIGSAITYARRYALSSILGVASEDDDDGNSAVNGSIQRR